MIYINTYMYTRLFKAFVYSPVFIMEIPCWNIKTNAVMFLTGPLVLISYSKSKSNVVGSPYCESRTCSERVLIIYRCPCTLASRCCGTFLYLQHPDAWICHICIITLAANRRWGVYLNSSTWVLKYNKIKGLKLHIAGKVYRDGEK